MLPLQLPLYPLTTRVINKKRCVLDIWRKKFIVLTPEEYVRQQFLLFLIHERNFPMGRIASEKTLHMNGMNKRCDAIVYNDKAEPYILIELKAPHVPLTQAVFDQVAVYNSKLKLQYFIISNGLEHYACKVNTENATYTFYSEIPLFQNWV